MRGPLLILLAVIALLANVVRGQEPAQRPQVHFALPLHGYFHPGRYMPVRVICDLPDHPGEVYLKLTGPEAMMTDLPLHHGQIDAIVPWLCYEPISDGPGVDFWPAVKPMPAVPSVRLRPLREDQKLAGFAAGDAMQTMELAQLLFAQRNGPSPQGNGGVEVIPLPLNSATPLPGPLAAWESLDLLVLDAAAASPTLDPQKLGALLGAGVTVALRDDRTPSTQPPFAHWPWRQVMVEGVRYWVLQYTPDGPGATYNDDAYRPVDSWRLEWPRRFRLQILGAGAIFCILVLGVLLLLKASASPRKAWIAIACLTFVMGAAMGVLGFWWHHQNPALSRAGDIIIINHLTSPQPPAGAGATTAQSASLTQIDSWVYEAAASTSFVDVSWADITHPIPASRQHLRSCAPDLRCAESGDPLYFHIVLPAESKMALLSRAVGPQGPHAKPVQPVTSPLGELARQYYLHQGDEIAGELASVPAILSPYQSQHPWPAVVVESHGR